MARAALARSPVALVGLVVVVVALATLGAVAAFTLAR